MSDTGEDTELTKADRAILFMVEWGQPLAWWQEDIVRRAFAQEITGE